VATSAPPTSAGRWASRWAIVVLLVDAAKGAAPVLLARAWTWALGRATGAVAAVVDTATTSSCAGNGGKGGGDLAGWRALAISPPAAGVAFLLYVLIYLLFRISSLGSLSGSSRFPRGAVAAGPRHPAYLAFAAARRSSCWCAIARTCGDCCAVKSSSVNCAADRSRPEQRLIESPRGMARAGQGCKVTAVWWRRPEPQVPFNRIEVVNSSDGGFFHWLIKFYVFGALCLRGAMFLGGIATYAYFSYRLPKLPDISRYSTRRLNPPGARLGRHHPGRLGHQAARGHPRQESRRC
jgi:hypothetical protein